MTALVDRQRLARVCGLLGSEHDGEALAAARQAEKIRKKVGLTWEELLVSSARQRSADPPPEELTDWRWACHFCLERYWSLTRWELDFVATVARYTKPPSAKQLIILHRLVARCRNAAA
ncbi:MAG: hypothetical protein ACJ8H8_03515 [Geminicoccaceae bacterium]